MQPRGPHSVHDDVPGVRLQPRTGASRHRDASGVVTGGERHECVGRRRAPGEPRAGARAGRYGRAAASHLLSLMAASTGARGGRRQLRHRAAPVPARGGTEDRRRFDAMPPSERCNCGRRFGAPAVGTVHCPTSERCTPRRQGERSLCRVRTSAQDECAPCHVLLSLLQTPQGHWIH